MLNPKVLVGECSIHVMLRGELLITLPHRMWEWEMGIEGEEKGEGVWSGESRGDQTTASLVMFLGEKIEGCRDRSELFDRLYEVLGELKSSKWNKTLREEAIEKKQKEEERKKGKKSETATVERGHRQETQGGEETPEEFEWSRAA